jgi:hypothetical protein
LDSSQERASTTFLIGPGLPENSTERSDLDGMTRPVLGVPEREAPLVDEPDDLVLSGMIAAFNTEWEGSPVGEIVIDIV